MPRALLLIDPQIDFIEGTLPVPGAIDAMNGLADFIKSEPDRYTLKIVTLDWHPWKHASFTANGGQWPSHCISHSRGAAIWPPLLSALHEGAGECLFLAKGQEAGRDEYSIFEKGGIPELFARLLAEHQIDMVDVCGLAGDICVLNTLKDALSLDLPVSFELLADFAPSLDGGKALTIFMESR